jgi:hypothetical protein
MDDLEINPQAESTGDLGRIKLEESPTIRTRKYFPETFIWDLLTTG